LLETMFSIQSVQNGYKEDSWGLDVQLSSAGEAEKRWRSSSFVSRKSACEDKSRKLVWNGRQPDSCQLGVEGWQLVELCKGGWEGMAL
jgi:hypothetical protein